MRMITSTLITLEIYFPTTGPATHMPPCESLDLKPNHQSGLNIFAISCTQNALRTVLIRAFNDRNSAHLRRLVKVDYFWPVWNSGIHKGVQFLLALLLYLSLYS